MINNSIGFNTIKNFNQIKDIHSDQAMQFIKQNKEQLANGYSADKIKEVAQEFESLLVYEMFKTMNKNISFEAENSSEEEVFIKKNQTEKIFQDFLTYEKSKLATSSGNLSLGLAEAMIKQFKQ